MWQVVGEYNGQVVHIAFTGAEWMCEFVLDEIIAGTRAFDSRLFYCIVSVG